MTSVYRRAFNSSPRLPYSFPFPTSLPSRPLLTFALALVASLTPITSIFGQVSQNVSSVLQRLILSQRALLVEGLINGVPPENITNFNGQVRKKD